MCIRHKCVVFVLSVFFLSACFAIAQILNICQVLSCNQKGEIVNTVSNQFWSLMHISDY